MNECAFERLLSHSIDLAALALKTAELTPGVDPGWARTRLGEAQQEWAQHKAECSICQQNR